MDSNIPSKPAYGVVILQLVCYLRCCNYQDFVHRSKVLTTMITLTRIMYVYQKLCSTYNTFVHITPGLYRSMGGIWRTSLLSTLLYTAVTKHKLGLMHTQPLSTHGVLLIYYACIAFNNFFSNLSLTQIRLCPLVLPVPPACVCQSTTCDKYDHYDLQTKDGCMKRGCFWRASTNLLDKASHPTAIYMHEIVVPISQLPQCSWWGLVLAKMCCAQWVTLHNT